MERIIKRVITGGFCAIVAVALLAGCESTNQKSSERTVADNDKITRDVRAKLRAEPMYKFDAVNVSTVDGIVQLRGIVNHPDQRRRAEELARSTAGVQDVLNGLVLEPRASLTPTGYQPGEIYSDPPLNMPPIEPR